MYSDSTGHHGLFESLLLPFSSLNLSKRIYRLTESMKEHAPSLRATDQHINDFNVKCLIVHRYLSLVLDWKRGEFQNGRGSIWSQV